MRKALALVLLCALSIAIRPFAYAKDPPSQVIVWPETGNPVLRFTFGKFKEIGSIGSEHTYVTDTTAENLWSKPIPNANFMLYLFDKNKIRIGEAHITVTDAAPGQTSSFRPPSPPQVHRRHCR